MQASSEHSFVVCAYKESPFLEEAICSLLSQSVQSEIKVSTSTPNDHISLLCEKYQLSLFINETPGLIGDDWNFAYNQAETPLVTLAHQDDVYEPAFVEKTLEVIDRFLLEEIQIVFSDYYEIRPEGRLDSSRMLKIKRFMNTPFRSSAFNSRPFIKRMVLSFGNPICCPAVTLVKANLGESVFDTQFINSCDFKTWIDLAFEKGRFIYLPEQLMGHRIYAESSTSLNLKNNIRKKEDLEIFSSLWPKFIARKINSIYVSSEKNNEL